MAAIHGDLQIDETFPREYDVEWLVDMPNSPNTKPYFLCPSPHGTGNGPVLRVTTERQRFVVVVGGSASHLRLLTWPDPNAFLALPSAALVNTAEPGASAVIEGFEGHSVHYVIPLVEQGLILIGHCCALYCYNASGLAWTINAFCCEDPVIEVSGDVLTLLAHKHGLDPGNSPVRKTFDLRSGQAL